MSTTTDRPAIRRPALLLQGTRGLLGLFGAVKLYGTAYFTFVATAEEGGVQTVADWLVAAWSTALAVAFLVAPRCVWAATAGSCPPSAQRCCSICCSAW